MSSAAFTDTIKELCRELGVEPSNVKEIWIDERTIRVETYVIDPDGPQGIDHRRAELTEMMGFQLHDRIIGTAKGSARRRP
jgi:hypothetical protein